MTDLTERLLADAGGWQAMKEARSLHEMDRVLAATWVPPMLEGRVRAGETEYRAGLKILSKSNVENLCMCRDSRQRGMICAHSLAIGIAVLKPRPVAKPAISGHPPATSGSGLSFSEDGELIELAIVIAPNLVSAWEKDSVMVGVEAITGGRRVLLSAVDPRRRYRASEIDRQMIDQFVAANAGALPGMLMLPRLIFSAMLAAFAGHPRVTLGKGATLRIAATPVARADIPLENADILSAATGDWMLCDNTLTPLLPVNPETTVTKVNRVTIGDSGERPEFFLKIEGSLNHLAAELESRIGNRRTTLGVSTSLTGHPSEHAAVQRMLDAGFSPPSRDGQFVLKGEPRILAFFATELPRFQRIWAVTIGERFTHVTRDVERVLPRFEVKSSGENWFDLSVELATPSGERFSAVEIQRLLQSGQRSVRLKNNKLAIFDTTLLDEFQEVLRDCDPSQRQPGLYRVSARHAGYLAEFASEQGAPVHAPPAWQKWTMREQGAIRSEAIDFAELEGVLRPYQKDGVKWLNQLMINGYAGLLADEMGLGKTLQILAFIRGIGRKHLVVCPSSLVFNWQREAARFAPDLKVVAVVGSDRAVALRQEAELYITSYPLLRRDAELYRDLEFETVVLDEAQHIKNPDSQNAQVAGTLQANHRFALTGTPIENSIRDIWSLMQFLMPGYLGKRDDFRERYEREIESDPGGPAHRRLIQRLRPFILRRTKREVVKELPDKIEQVAYCELSQEQREIYSQLTETTRRQLFELAGRGNQSRARMTMLTALLRLRQACCDVRLLRPEIVEIEPSGKVEMLRELLSEALDGGHRVLVFSQFATMLRLLKETLSADGIAVCHLDGQTRDRSAEVDRFQAGEAAVFLISLKAGGTGLNLTAADTVIHFDPWWNPAIEAQATDRAHRIGQEKVVTSYKLITRNTVEEKILALQQRKKAVIAASLESEEPLMESLSIAEIEELLN